MPLIHASNSSLTHVFLGLCNLRSFITLYKFEERAYMIINTLQRIKPS